MEKLIIKDIKTELTYEDREYIEDHLKENFGLSNSFFSYCKDGKYRFNSHDSFKFKRKRYCLYFTLTVDNDVVIATTPKRYTDYQFENNDYDAASVEFYIIPISFSTKIRNNINKLLYIIKKEFVKILLIINFLLFFAAFLATTVGYLEATKFRQSIYAFCLSILFFSQILTYRSNRKEIDKQVDNYK